MITEKKSRVLVAAEDSALRLEVRSVFGQIGFAAVDEAVSAAQAEALIAERPYAIAVCDGSSSTAEAMQLAYSVMSRRVTADSQTVLLIIGEASCRELLSEVCRSTGAGLIMKPFTAPELCTMAMGLLSSRDKLSQDTSLSGPPCVPDDDLDIEITEILHSLGIPAHIKGFSYIRCAIGMAVADPDVINYVTKLIYPGVARTFDTTTSRVERAIRHAIEVAWDRGDVDTLNSYFGYTISRQRGKPTNSEFIAMISDKLRLKARR